MEIKGIRTVLYARVSTEKQAREKEASLPEQIAEMEYAAKSRGWIIIDKIYEAVSGSVPFNMREGGAKVYQLATEKEIDLIMLYDNDRIGRDTDAVVAKVFRADMRFKGIQIFSVHQPIEPKKPSEFEPYEDDASLWMETMTDTASSVSIRQFIRRRAIGMRNRIETKKLLAGTPPTGYLAERITLPNGKTMLGERKIDEIYAPIIEKIFNEYEMGRSFQAIAGILNISGIRTPKGYLWTSTTIKGIINNPTYYGATVYYKDKSIGKPDSRYVNRRRRIHQSMDKWLIIDNGLHPAIISKEQWERCQALKRAKGSYGRTYGESTLLSGLLKCGLCNGSMFKQSSWQGGYFSCNRYYKTGKSQCKPNSIKRIDLEKNILEYISTLTKDPEILDRLKATHNSDAIRRCEANIQHYEKQNLLLQTVLNKAREAFEAGVDSLSEYALRKDEIKQRQPSIQVLLLQTSNDIRRLKKNTKIRKSLVALLSDFTEKFNKKPLRIQKILLREIVERIEVKNKKVKIIFKDSVFNSTDYERTMEIAAAGGHNLLLKGPPGAGKTLLARTFPSILPALTFQEAVEVTKIYSIAGLLKKEAVVSRRPFRSPHHTTSLVGLIGGSSHPRPGEITLAHRGVLFLDEFPEFPRQILESLRQPIEDGIVSIARANSKVTFPAKCMLLAAQNPCLCGYLGDKSHSCTCQPSQILRYQKKISGPLLDRIDIHLDVPAVKVEKLTEKDNAGAESSRAIRVRVQAARERQHKRFADTLLSSNAEMSSKLLTQFCPLSDDCLQLLRQAVSTLNLSGRGYHRTIKLARTIADLAGDDVIKVNHIAEALQYRPRTQTLS